MDNALLTSLVGIAGTPVVTALVSATVKPFVSDNRVYGVAALLYGIAWNLLLAVGIQEASGTRPLWIAALVGGILTGLAASGFYSSVKTDVVKGLSVVTTDEP